VVTATRKSVNRSSAKACGVFTTTTSVNDSASPSTTTSTSGSTFAYVNVAPDTDGAGRSNGNDSVTTPSPSGALNSTNGPCPPAENDASTATDLDVNRPSEPRTTLVSTGTQPEPSRTRTGRDDDDIVNTPSGFAVTTLVWVVNASTTTGSPDRAAAANAADSAPATDTGPTPDTPGSAHTDTG